MATVCVEIARAVVALRNCEKSGNDFADIHRERISEMVSEYLPNGSGFDSGTEIDLAESDGETRLTFRTSFHHMDDNGAYCGWTEHRVVVSPSLALGTSIRVTGRDKRGIKDYIGETFHHALERALA